MAQQKLPIIFTHNGNEYAGELSSVQGAGDNRVFHLMVNNYYQGRLRFTERWIFDGKFPDLAEGFGWMAIQKWF